MIRFIINIYTWLYIKFNSVMIVFMLSLHKLEGDVLKADPNNIDEKDKKVTRKRNRLQFLERFYAGKTDEKYVQQYYEILKKSDEFIRNSDSKKYQYAANRHGSNFGMKDQYGRRYEHYGFFDEKHKNHGKTLGEVLELEIKERKTNDDDYELIYIFNNEPVEVGLSKIFDIVKENDSDISKYKEMSITEKSKQYKFPIRGIRDDENCVNKIEQLSQFLHVKKIGFEYRQLEFFIPEKFKTINYDENSNIFKDLINVKEIYVNDSYGSLIGFSVLKYTKRIEYNGFDVIKFDAIEMKIIETN